MRIKADGNVGIGTASPEAKLHVKGSEGLVLQSGSGGGDERWMFDSNGYQGYLGIGFSATSTPGTPKLVIKEDGKVGIGTAAPGATLTLSDGTDNFNFNVTTNALAVKTSTADGADDQEILIDAGSGGLSSTRGAYIRVHGNEHSNRAGQAIYQCGNLSSSAHIFRKAGGTDAVTFKSDGKVGIGTASPNQLLHLEKSDTNTNALATGAGPQILLKNPSDTDGNIASIDFYNSTGYMTGRIGAQFVNAGDRNTDLYFATRADSGALTERLRILSDGKVGIGTTPVYALEVVTGANEIGFEHDTHANGTQTIKFNPSSTKAGGTSKIYSSYAGSGATEGKLALGTYSAQTALTIDSGGRVGINNTSPNNRFEVSGTSKFTGNVNIGAAGAGWDALFQSTTSGQYWEWDASMSLTRYRDNTKAVFGNGDDLQIYHDGNNWIDANGAGDLYLRNLNSSGDVIVQAGASGDAYIKVNSGETALKATNNGAVELYYDNSKKFETTSAGISITGQLSATTKSFLIDHPTKPGKKLRHGSLEGPENGVYIRGKSNNNIIELPEYWTKLVDEDSITVQLTPIGKHQHIYVESIKNNVIHIQSDEARKNTNNLEYYYLILAERKDVAKMEIEE
jgi:hypothetical protein